MTANPKVCVAILKQPLKALHCFLKRFLSSSSNHPILTQLQRCDTLYGLQSIYAAMIKTNSNQDSFFMNQFVSACSRLHQMGHGYKAFVEMAGPNAFVYNATIGGLIQHFEVSKALRLYTDMLKSSVLPTSFTLSHLIKACTQTSAAELGEAVHGQIHKTGFVPQLVVQTGLIDFYSSLEKIVEAKKVFDEMSEKDVFSWTVMILGHARVGDMESARAIFDDMPQKSTVSWNTMIAGYGRSGDVKMAVSLFTKMPNRDLISWTTMISCFSQNKCFKGAVEVFEGMKTAGLSPDEVTMATVIAACAHLGALDIGRELHLYVMFNGFTLDVYLGSALVDMFAKCGSIERALLVFYKLEEKNLFCWNSIIEGLAAHGLAKEAVDMFTRLKTESEIQPNSVSFLSVLSACSHRGLLEDGRRLFSSMITDYSICPEMEHYGCMIDLLGRAALLEEALCLIQSMEMEPNSVIWGALLSSCKIYGNLEIGKIAVEKLLAVEPAQNAHYMLLVNMYVEANQWDKVAEARSWLSERGVKKRGPGCSWIEIDRVVHEFSACDFAHPSSHEIELMLVELDGTVKLMGYCLEQDFNSQCSVLSRPAIIYSKING